MAGMTLSDLRQSVARGNFVVFGRAGMDLFADPVGVKSEEAEVFHAGLGGSSANIAAGLCKLGQHSALVTSVSNDAVGRFCLNQLKQYGVDARYVKSIDGEYRTSMAIYESRTENFQNVIYRNGAADFQVTEADVDRVDLTPYGALVTAGTVFAAEPSRSATFHAFERARVAGLPIVFDIDYRPYSWPSADVASDVLSRAGALSDVIVGNDEEFGFMAGGIDKGLAKARELSQDGAAIVIYKMGEKGAITFAEGEETRTGVFPVEAIKPVGAGDTFMAGFLAALAEARALKEAVTRGSAAAAIVVTRPGCSPAMPTGAELDAFLEDRTESLEG
ncbi:5-dehydro-2-deoxygluconokinase [Alphaproteobacteria bacterium GH1-50]|uniref:5-dehydro-2-deoxygluconokinase n=1 Tax=Kangsaoukella pontilimi TaxID=2691042 RepID=A0A7C9ME66_9RHOB|nr:5-dehydro-2-deoxygluconokinase [Kangsaoukella pontilimi]MXQ06836.1 5-dehydro-2-deoxygluconokinase [Kangsaoukella pontilimi]